MTGQGFINSVFSRIIREYLIWLDNIVRVVPHRGGNSKQSNFIFLVNKTSSILSGLGDKNGSLHHCSIILRTLYIRETRMFSNKRLRRQYCINQHHLGSTTGYTLLKAIGGERKRPEDSLWLPAY